MATVVQNESKKELYHTNAEYRCKVMEVRKNFYVVKMVNIVKNHGEKKTLHIPRRDLFVKKDLVSEKLLKNDYLNLKFTYLNRRYNVTEVLSVNMLSRISTEEKKTNSNKTKESSTVERVNPNPFAALAWSESDSDEDN